MNRRRAAVGVALGAAALALGVAAPAQASVNHHHSVPLVIHEQLDFANNVLRFTAKGPLCHSGSWVDDVTDLQPLNPQQTVYRVKIDSVYTCDDGSGTFDGRKVIVLHLLPDGSQYSTGPIKLTGGTGRYCDLRAFGTDTGGANAQGLGTGIVRGRIDRL